MGLRIIPFGYTIRNGKTVIQEAEAKIVNEIFALYAEGKTLKDIADYLTESKIVFHEDKVTWNKNKVNRIIENEKYMGTDIYPSVISEAIFNRAKVAKNKKSCKQEKQSQEIEYLRSICICDKCIGRYRRINTWGTREKWLCSNGCSCQTYIDDSILENAVIDALNTVIREPDRLDVVTNSQFQPTNLAVREENELIRLLEQQQIDFKTVSTCILKGAAVRFDCCEYDNGEITAELKTELSELTPMEHLDYRTMKKYIKQVIINPDGLIRTVFINDARITMNGGAEDAS